MLSSEDLISVFVASFTVILKYADIFSCAEKLTTELSIPVPITSNRNEARE